MRLCTPFGNLCGNFIDTQCVVSRRGCNNVWISSDDNMVPDNVTIAIQSLHSFSQSIGPVIVLKERVTVVGISIFSSISTQTNGDGLTLMNVLGNNIHLGRS